MSSLVLALGLVFVAEGLLLALFPGRVVEAIRYLLSLPVEARRSLGLIALATGIMLVWAAHHLA